MKQFVHTKPCNSIELNDYSPNGDNIVAYKTSGTGMIAILRHQLGRWGFAYLKDLFQTEVNHCDYKYKSCSPKESIKSVMNDGKAIYYFTCYSDFIKWIREAS